jgi:hypothetical protein
MSKLHHAVGRAAAAIALCSATASALATWHPIIEGEYFSDYDAPDAPDSFNIFPAGIYDPTVNLVGHVDWQNDASDTIYFRIGSAGAAGYSLRQFRADFSTSPQLTSGDQGLHLLLRPAAPSSPPLLSIDLMAGSVGSAGIADSALRLNSGELYALTFSSLGSTDSGAVATYYLGLSVNGPVPEPSGWALLLAGAAFVAWAGRHLSRR